MEREREEIILLLERINNKKSLSLIKHFVQAFAGNKKE